MFRILAIVSLSLNLRVDFEIYDGTIASFIFLLAFSVEESMNNLCSLKGNLEPQGKVTCIVGLVLLILMTIYETAAVDTIEWSDYLKL